MVVQRRSGKTMERSRRLSFAGSTFKGVLRGTKYTDASALRGKKSLEKWGRLVVIMLASRS